MLYLNVNVQIYITYAISVFVLIYHKNAVYLSMSKGSCTFNLQFWTFSMTFITECTEHPPLLNGSFTLSYDHGFWSLATHYCDPGFYLNGSRTSNCNGGPWTFPHPNCACMLNLYFVRDWHNVHFCISINKFVCIYFFPLSLNKYNCSTPVKIP